MKPIFKFFYSRHKFALLLTFLIIFLGLRSGLTIKKDMFPSADLDRVIISTIFPGASPGDVEVNVTNRIETQLQNVSGIKKFSSVSLEGLSSIDITLDTDVKNADDIRKDIQDALDRVVDLPLSLPDPPKMQAIDSSLIPFIEVGFYTDLPYKEFQNIAKIFKDRLLDIQGVAQVDKFGFQDREIKIKLDPKKLTDYNLTVSEIQRSIQSRNQRITAGSFIQDDNVERNIISISEFNEPKDVGDVVIQSNYSGNILKLKDISHIEDSHEKTTKLTKINGKKAVSFIIYKSSSADILKTTDKIKLFLETEKNDLLKDCESIIARDMSQYVRNRFNIVKNNGLIGLFLVVLVLSLFLSFKSALWVSLGIPVSVLGVLMMLPILGYHLDVISLAATIIVIGIIVDDAIIVSENIFNKREMGLTPLNAAVEGVSEVFKPVITTILTTLVAFAPMFFMPGIVGKFIFVIPLVISLALIISLIECIIALPAHLIPTIKHIKPKKLLKDKESPNNLDTVSSNRVWFDRLRNNFERYLYNILDKRYIVFFVFITLFSSSIFYAYKYMDFLLFPTNTANEITVEFEMKHGTPLQTTYNKMAEFESIVLKLPKAELSSIITRVGVKLNREYVQDSTNTAYVTITLTPFDKRARDADQIASWIRSETKSITGFKRIDFNIEAGGPPVGKPINIRIITNDEIKRTTLTNQIESYLKTVDGVLEINRDDLPGKPEIKLDIDYEKLARFNINLFDFNTTLRTAFDGIIVTRLRYQNEDVNFRLIFDDFNKKGFSKIESISIPNRSGQLIPLSNLVEFKEIPGSPNLYHYDGDRATRIIGNLKKELTPIKLTKLVKDKFSTIAEEQNINLIFGGASQETTDSFQSLFMLFLIAVFAIYFILVILFDSVTQPLVVIVAIPFGIMGVIFTFALHGQDLGFMAMLGTVGLSGVVVNDSLVLVDKINRLRKEFPNKSLEYIVALGSASRLRAIILTSLSTIFGVIPLAYGIGGMDPFIAPMGLALGYGLFFATPLTLILVPSLYLIRHDILNLITKSKSKITRKFK